MGRPTVLVVDDEAINRKLLNQYLKDEGYNTELAEDGQSALTCLEKDPARYSAVLLDRMMPDMDGITVLQKMKAHDSLKTIPVVMQTAKARREEIQQGLESGSYYYLTKPFDKLTLLAIVKSAIEQYDFSHGLIKELEQTADTLSLMTSGEFEFQTLDEARNLSTLLAKAGPEPTRLVTGLSELMINAIEHGNLGITYDEKSELMKNNTWHDEIIRRLALKENQDKKVSVKFRRLAEQLEYEISDCGTGFDFDNYLNIDLTSVFESHGRGIVMAKMLSFSSLQYVGCGNKLVATVKL